MHETSEHTKSYYAVTVNWQTDYPHLQGEQRCDVFERMRHIKLPGGKWFANPALALGMLYYRLKEIL